MIASSRTLPNTLSFLGSKLGEYWAMTKCLQTGLLVLTGVAGYVSTQAPLDWPGALSVIGTLFLAISGSTMLNMVCDQDIDAKMQRTACRSLPAGRVTRAEAVGLGVTLAACGILWSFVLSPLYGVVIFAGLFCDVVVYTIWLKRQTPWSIVWGGISGGMPILAGRVLGSGTIDTLGIALALAVLFWIPTHILTFSLRNATDYCLAGVPVFPNAYGAQATRRIIAGSTFAAVLIMLFAIWRMALRWDILPLAAFLGIVLLALTALNVLRPSSRLEFVLYKLASLYMLGSMILILVGRSVVR